MRLGTIDITHSVECKCGEYVAEGGTLKRAYFWLTVHLLLSRNHQGDRVPLSTFWALLRWKENL